MSLSESGLYSEYEGSHSTFSFTGVEFSGRTELRLQRSTNSIKGEVGLNSEPAPFRSRLGPGETFFTPTIFLGASRGGPDGAGNVLRRWVGDVLGNPETWHNPNYPLLGTTVGAAAG